jgi:hypothetical protein
MRRRVFTLAGSLGLALGCSEPAKEVEQTPMDLPPASVSYAPSPPPPLVTRTEPGPLSTPPPPMPQVPDPFEYGPNGNREVEVMDPLGLAADPGCVWPQVRCNTGCYDLGQENAECDFVQLGDARAR